MTTLRDPFATIHKKDIKNKAGEVVAQVDYVGWSQAADRLDEAAPEGWSFAIMATGPDWVHGRLTLGDRWFENIGYAENADAQWKKEVLKDATSDAFKRCAALAGVARYLYDKDSPSAGRVSLPARPVATPAHSDDPYEGLPNEWEAPAKEEGGLCPEHGAAWTLRPGGVSKAGKEYGAFWTCKERTDGEFCQEKPSKAWQARHEG